MFTFFLSLANAVPLNQLYSKGVTQGIETTTRAQTVRSWGVFCFVFFCTCAYKTGVATVNEIIIVRQDEGAPLLHLQAILSAGDSLTAVPLGGLEVLRTQPGLINHLGGRQRGLRAGGQRGYG